MRKLGVQFPREGGGHFSVGHQFHFSRGYGRAAGTRLSLFRILLGLDLSGGSHRRGLVLLWCRSGFVNEVEPSGW